MWTERGIGPRRCRVARLAVLVAILGCGLPSVARAAADCFADESCNALLVQAKRAHNEKRYVDALRLYQSAHDKVPDPRILVLRGRSYFKQGQTERALDLYRAALPQLKDAEERQGAERFIAEAESALRAQSAAAAADPVAPPNLLPPGPLPPGPGAAALPAGPGVARTPVYKKWWFWTIVGVAAVGTGTAIGLGVYAKGASTDGLPGVTPFGN